MINTAKEIQETLLLLNFECFIVGGAVRDLILDIPINDIDLVTNAKPEELQKVFKNRTINVRGKTFKVVIIDNVEVATYRKDIQKVLFHAKHCKPVYAKTLEEDLGRRDFTINAMAVKSLNVKKDKIIDPFNGKADLEAKIIKFVGNPNKRILEDPVRIIRACRFLAKIEGSFEKNTFVALKQQVDLIKTCIDPERIRLEILKAMSLERPSLFFCALRVIGGLKHIFKSLDNSFNFKGHGLHHIESISEHCMLAGDNIHTKFKLLRLAAYLHDVGKPISYKPDGSFCGHEKTGKNIIIKELKRLKFSNKEIKYVSNLVFVHMRICIDLSPKGKRKLLTFLHNNNINTKDYLRLKLADRQANIKHDSNSIYMIKRLIKACTPSKECKPFTIHSLKLKGGDIIKIFKLKPGPLVGEIQKYLLKLVIQKGTSFNTKKDLQKAALKYLQKK